VLNNIRDTFLHFIADNLSSGMTFQYIHRDPDDPDSELLKMNAVNISYQGLSLSFDTDKQFVVIDVVSDYEETAVTWIHSIVSLLRSAYYTPILDYTNPSSPTPVWGNVMWPKAPIIFRRINSDNYSHYTCELTLEFQIS
jgi:hypothetical protein